MNTKFNVKKLCLFLYTGVSIGIIGILSDQIEDKIYKLIFIIFAAIVSGILKAVTSKVFDKSEEK